MIRVFFVCILFSLINLVQADEYYVENFGEITFNGSFFGEDSSSSNISNSTRFLNINPKLYIENNGLNYNLELIIKSLSNDNNLYFDIKEANINFSIGDYDLLIGNSIEFWGKTDSFNLVDIINSKNFNEGLVNPIKMGEFMIKSTSELGLGNLSLYYLPIFRKNNYPSNNSRLSFSSFPDNETASYSNGASRDIHQFALRWDGYYDDFDFGFSAFSGNSRDPSFSQVNSLLHPSYTKIEQYGFEIQQTLSNIILKSEIISRYGQPNKSGNIQPYQATVIGLEKTFYSFLNNNLDLTSMIEFTKDSRGLSSHNANQNDIFLINRIVFNDLQDSSISSMLSNDLNTNTGSFIMNFTRRYFNSLKAEFGIFSPINLNKDNHLSSISNDINLNFNLTWAW